jgi:hypothetical protein
MHLSVSSFPRNLVLCIGKETQPPATTTSHDHQPRSHNQNQLLFEDFLVRPNDEERKLLGFDHVL